MSEPVRIDARGHRCPVPSLRLRRAMAAQAPGLVFELLATDPMARIDVPYLMQQTGGEVLSLVEADGVLTITVRSGAGQAV